MGSRERLPFQPPPPQKRRSSGRNLEKVLQIFPTSGKPLERRNEGKKKKPAFIRPSLLCARVRDAEASERPSRASRNLAPYFYLRQSRPLSLGRGRHSPLLAANPSASHFTFALCNPFGWKWKSVCRSSLFFSLPFPRLYFAPRCFQSKPMADEDQRRTSSIQINPRILTKMC